MNPLYDQTLNQQYINPEYLNSFKCSITNEQQTEILKAIKALHDYYDAARKIEPAY